METLILKLATADNIQFGVVSIILLAIVSYVVKWVMERNKELVNQNQENTRAFLTQLNHQQTKNREALHHNTDALGKISENISKNNEINEKLLDILRNK